MAIATFICESCGQTKQITFTPGKLTKPHCDKCNKEMKRDWKNIGSGSVVEDSVLYATEIMQNAGMVTKDKLIY